MCYFYTLVCAFFSVAQTTRLCVVSSLCALRRLHAFILLHDSGNDLVYLSRVSHCVSILVCVAWEPLYVSLVPCCQGTRFEVFEQV